MYGQPSVFCALNVYDICIVSLLPLLKLYCILKIEGGFLKPWKPPSLRPWGWYSILMQGLLDVGVAK